MYILYFVFEVFFWQRCFWARSDEQQTESFTEFPSKTEKMGYKYYDTPDGEDCFLKMWYLSKNAAVLGKFSDCKFQFSYLVFRNLRPPLK